jgi:hypothetical protein
MFSKKKKKKCTERQFPPADVAQLLDSTVTSLQPCCPQNLPIYAERQKCMGIIRNQILAGQENSFAETCKKDTQTKKLAPSLSPTKAAIYT